jgi:ribosomal protein S18 acetylase RimI-like enzyme
MQISKAVLDDVPRLEKLINSAYRGESSKKGWTTEADFLEGIRTDEDSLLEMIKNPHAVILKYSDGDNNLLGCVYLEKQKDQMYLGMLTVSPTQQAKGIGKILLAASEKFARKENCYEMEMTVISIRNELIGWYEKHGYFKTGEKKPFPSDIKFGIPKIPLEFIVMKKKL